jgi:hypothetical protein
MKTILSVSLAVAFLVGAAGQVQAQYGYGDDHAQFHHELGHRAYDRAGTHYNSHQYPMTRYQHHQLHDALDHEAYHDQLEHRAYHRGVQYGANYGYRSSGYSNYIGGYGTGGYYQPAYGPSYSQGSLQMSYPRAGFSFRWAR